MSSSNDWLDDRLIYQAVLQADALRRLALRGHVCVAVALLMGSLVAPLGKIVVPEEETALGVDDAVRIPLTLLRLLGFTVDPPSAHQLGGLEAHPFAIPGGVFLVGLGTIVVAVALVANLVLCWMVLRDDLRTAMRRIALVAVALLVVGTLCLWLGLVWLPDGHDAAPGPAWGMWLLLASAVWLGSGLRARREFDDA